MSPKKAAKKTKAPKKRPRGRPPLAPEAVKTTLTVRISQGRLQLLREEAERAGMGLPQLVRERYLFDDE